MRKVSDSEGVSCDDVARRFIARTTLGDRPPHECSASGQLSASCTRSHNIYSMLANPRHHFSHPNNSFPTETLNNVES